MKTLELDLETFSDVDLLSAGVFPYAESSQFDLLLFGYSVDGGEVQVVDVVNGECIPDHILKALTDDSVLKYAHNASFERICLSVYTNEDFKNNILGIWEQIKSTFSNLTQGITDRINALGFNFESFTDMLKAAWDALCNLLAPVFEGVFQNIANIFSEISGIILGLLDVFIGLFTGNWDQLWNGVKGIFTSIWEFIVNTFSNILNTLKGIADVVLGWFGTS